MGTTLATGHQHDNKNTYETNILCSLTFKVFKKHTFFRTKHSAKRCCVSFFATSVQAFSFASVKAFPSCPQKHDCRSDQNARRLNHNACCFKLFRKPHPARSCIYLKATFTLVVIIVSWRWDQWRNKGGGQGGTSAPMRSVFGAPN